MLAPKEVLQTVRVTKDLLGILDTAHLKTLTLAMNTAAKGALIVTDVEITE